MKKFLHSFLILFMGINATAFAQQEAETITTWTGATKRIELFRGDKMTFEYTATADGTLYIYADDQSAEDNVLLSIWGGCYHDGAYDADSPLQEAGFYEGNLGIYGWIKVYTDDVIRFTISAADDAAGEATMFKLKSVFFASSSGYQQGGLGSSYESPVTLTQNTKTSLPPNQNYDKDYLANLNYATFCRFVAPSDGVASIFTEEYLIYYIEEDLYGSADEPLKYASKDAETYDHEFIVEKGKTYIVIIPNSRPTEATFQMNYDRLGLSEKFPIEITTLPTTLSLVKGDNYYRFSHELIGDNTTLEVAVAAGWNGTITYFEGTTESEELTADAVAGQATTFYKNVDTRFLNDNGVVVNFNVEDQSTAKATLSLREPAAGESFSTAVAATLGENAFSGSARDYWFAYTAEADEEVSFESSSSIKHVNFTAGVELLIPTNVYRVNEGETIYVCVAPTTAGNHTLTITNKEIVAGDYCDNPILFELGKDINVAGRGVDCYYSFTATEDGFAIFHSTDWTVHFRNECGGGRLNPTQTVDAEGSEVKYTYKLPINAGKSYIVEVEVVTEDIVITTGFEAAVTGDVCATAIEVETLNDTLKFDYEFEVETWYKVTAEKDGYFTIYAKLGYTGNMKTKVGDCDAKETNANNDDSKSNAYMGGYKAARVYVEEGQTLYIYTKTGSENNEEEFGANFYMLPTFAEPRPGENANIAISAQESTAYEVMANDANGYEQWYSYVIPANKELTINLTSQVKFLSSALSFYKEDKTTYMSSYKGDYTQTNITNEAGETIGKNYSFATAETERTIYIKVSVVNAMYLPVVWEIEGNSTGDDNTSDIENLEFTDQDSQVIYDLMGRRVEKPTKGIYIINGVKRVIK